jgi:hypothetical protein
MADTTNNSNSDDNEYKTPRSVTQKLDLLDSKMDSLYKDIHLSRTDDVHNLDDIIDNMDTAIDKLQFNDTNSSGVVELLRRLEGGSKSNTEKLMSSVQDLFQNDNLLTNLFATEEIHKFIQAENYNYDMICKYMPKLLDALEIKRDNVLSSDNFSKNFINPKYSKTSKKEVAKFTANSKRLERIYDFQDFIDRVYMKTSKYGEAFVYCVPYNTAFDQLLKRRRMYGHQGGQMLPQNRLYENAYIDAPSRTILEESYTVTSDFKSYVKQVSEEADISEKSLMEGMPDLGEVTITFNDSGMINSYIEESYIATESEKIKAFKSLSSLHESNKMSGEVVSEAGSSNQNQMVSIFKGHPQKGRLRNTASAEGLIVSSIDDDSAEKITDINGAVLEILPRENVIPIYFDKRCVGYYYLDIMEDPGKCGFCGGNHTTPGITNAAMFQQDMSGEQQELVTRYIAAKISAQIDSHFINANKDLKNEIYAVLNYNDKFNVTKANNIAVTFIPADDIVHCYFDFDEHTHRGISDLRKSLVPAMLYILLYLTDVIGKITRSNDKRVYYVKQNVEQNTARTMMNVVAQIKKGNFGMRQIESMNNILNVVGKYNDYVIPLGPSGDPPIQFEVMQGQEVNTPTDLMEKMEEAAVNATGTPFEFVNSTMQQDFATRFTMSNSRYLKGITTRQRKVEKFVSKIYTKTYNYEFDEDNTEIEIILPPPYYLALQNNAQMFDNVNNMADKIIDSELSSEPDEVKSEFRKIYVRNILGTYIDFDDVDRLTQMARINVEVNKPPATADGGAGDADPASMMDDDF